MGNIVDSQHNNNSNRPGYHQRQGSKITASVMVIKLEDNNINCGNNSFLNQQFPNTFPFGVTATAGDGQALRTLVSGRVASLQNRLTQT